ncbi:MAG: DUF1134 domain-containing protein [Thermodesulfovibrionales bacterium]|jgi:hypothetical protein
MKRLMVSVFVLVLALSIFGLAFAEDANPSATLKLTEGQIGLGVGWSWGKGVLTFMGEEHPFKVSGLSVGDVGITKADAAGSVYHLKQLSDFNGTYVAAAAEATIGGGEGVTTMKNQNGVVINLKSTTQGVNIKLAPEGVKLTLQE